MRIGVVGLVVALITLMLLLQGKNENRTVAMAERDETETAPVLPINCRFGVAYTYESAGADAWIPTLGAGWFVNFSWYEVPNPYADYIFTIRLRQVFDVNGVRLPDYNVFPPVTDYFIEDGEINPGLGTYVKNSPGRLWLVGNEIEIDNQRQDNIMPDIYARAYHEIYHYIKEIDPTAQIAIGSVTMGTPGRMQYLDIIWDTYKELYGTEPPVDVWNVHLYILAERTPRKEPQYGPGKIALGTDPNLAIFSSVNDPKKCPLPGLPDTWENDPRHDTYCKSERDSVRIFEDQLLRIRRWMKDHGQQDKPLIISEFGSLASYDPNHPPGMCSSQQETDEFGNCMDPVRVTKYLESTTRLMHEWKDPELGYLKDENRLVQRWLWYSLNEYVNGIGGSSNLVVDNFRDFAPGSEYALTMMGQAFRNEALSHEYPANIVAGEAPDAAAFAENPDGTASVSLTIPFRNNGSFNIYYPFNVTLYRDQQGTQPIGVISYDPSIAGAVRGCNWEGEDNGSVTLTVSGLQPGRHQYWVKFDSENYIVEVDENDNMATGFIEVYSSQVFSHRNFVPIVNNN